MKKGHRRTQSANIVTSMHEEPQFVAQANFKSLNKNCIPYLLLKCQDNIKEKISNVDSLHVRIKGDEDKMFNFGKGMLKSNVGKQQKQKNDQWLISIPEKLKPQGGKVKRVSQADTTSKNKERSQYQSVLKIKNKNVEKDKVTTNDAITKIVKAKMGFPVEGKSRKLSLHEACAKMVLKQWKHKKEPSNSKF